MALAISRRRVVLIVAAALTAALLMAPGAPRATKAVTPKGPVILTLAGDIALANRGPLDPKLDGVFKHHEIGFTRAFVFDRAMLEALPQEEFEAQLPEGHEPAVFRGPRLSTVLKSAGAPVGVAIRATALDGYVAELTAEDIEGRDWVLVISRNDTPFGIGGFGPALLLERPKDVKVAEDAPWPWAVFFIEVTK